MEEPKGKRPENITVPEDDFRRLGALLSRHGPLLITQQQRAINEVAKSDPANIQQVAASQLDLINSYYASVLSQAQQSFRAALGAGVAGLVFFVAAVSFELLRQPTNVATISVISGAIVEVIAAINFYLYGRAASQLAAFHVRLDQTQRYLIANSVCENLQGEIKHATRADLVRVIAGTPTLPSKPAKAKAKDDSAG